MPNFWGCRCCGTNKYDVLAYSGDDGQITKRQFHHHGGYNTESGIKPGSKISVSAWENLVICASNTNLSVLSESRSGEATRFYKGLAGGVTGLTTSVTDVVNSGNYVYTDWRIGKRSYSGDWWAACVQYGKETPNSEIQYQSRIWKVNSIGCTGVPTRFSAIGSYSGFIGGGLQQIELVDDPRFNTATDAWWVTKHGLANSNTPHVCIDGTVPQSLIGGLQAFKYYTGFSVHPSSSDFISAQFDFTGRLYEWKQPPLAWNDAVRRSQYYDGGAMLYHDTQFGYCTRSQNSDDGPVAGNTITLAMNAYPLRNPDDPAVAWYPETSDGGAMVGAICSVDENSVFHAIAHSYEADNTLRYKLGTCTYRAYDFLQPVSVEFGFSGSGVYKDVPTCTRTVISPFGVHAPTGAPYIPKDIFVDDAGEYLYTLLADEDNPYYWRRLVKVRLSDMAIIWTKTPPEEWQVFHAISMSNGVVWVAVSASDGSVFTDPI